MQAPDSRPLPGDERPPLRPPGLGRATALVGLASMIGRLSGLARDVVFADRFGAGAAADAFFAASRVPGLLRELLVEGTLVNVSVPLLSRAEAEEGREAMWGLANALLGALLLILGGVTLIFVLLAKPLVLLLAGGFGQDKEKLALATWLARLLAPLLAGLSVASLFSAMLNVRGRFFLPALAPLVLNVGAILATLLADRWEQWSGTPAIGAVALATTLSGLLTALLQLPLLLREGYRPWPRLRADPALWRALGFGAAALIGIAAVQLNLIVETQLASRLGDGPVSWLTLGFRVVQIPLGVAAGSVAVAGLARVSGHMARGERDLVRAALGRTLSLNNFLVAPMAVGMWIVAVPLVRLLFERGAFGPSDTLATAAVLRMYALASLGICLHRVVVPLFFAIENPYLPMGASVAGMLLKLPVALLCTETLGLGVAGLPLSHALLVSAEVAVLLWALQRRVGSFEEGFWSNQGKIALSCAGLGLVAGAAMPWAADAGKVGVLAVVALGAATYAALALALRVPEASDLLRRLLPPPPPGRR